ncbi:hypothetical protein [Streptomyces adustus]
MDDPDGQDPREQYEHRDDEVDAVLDELQEALYPAALDLRENASHIPACWGCPVPQARPAAERVDERIPPCGGSLREAARRDITEAHQAAGHGL